MVDYVRTETIATIQNAKDFDPVVAGQIFEELAAARGGNLSPEDIWQAAKDDPSHPLHKHFNWNIQDAAQRYWTYQARAMIRLVSINIPGMQKPVRAFVSFPSDTGGRKYYQMEDVIRSDDFLERLLAQAARDAEIFFRRYQHFVELKEVVQAARTTAEIARAQHERLVARRKKRRHTDGNGEQPSA